VELALKLLFEGIVSRIILNDIDWNLYYFWDSVLNKTNDLCKKIENTDITYSKFKNK
jgi:DNA adenine methylase